MTYRYLPPPFDLYEFDDEPLGMGPAGARRLHDWNGLAGRPAEEVSLAWSTGDAAVLVATSGRNYDAAWVRMSAAHLALGGDALPVPSRPGNAKDVQLEIARIASAEGLWSAGPVIVHGSPPAVITECGDFFLAYSSAGSETVFVAAAGISPGQLRVRRVRDWSLYDFDATRSHALSDLNR